ncbi:PadR family transcriptional regulator [bacterium]|nr:PadR family transcriptional regulator [bacterium]
MASEHVMKHFFGGFVRLHILYHAEKGPVCGVEMIEELQRHGYRLSPGTLYPILHSLETNGLVSCETALVSGRRRKNYRITPEGSELLTEARSRLRELFSELINDLDTSATAARTSKSRRSRRPPSRG